MNKQPLYATLLALALGGCVAQKPALDVAPVTAPLHSEFTVQSEEASFFGPFLAATQAQQDEQYSKAGEFFMQALAADPDSKFVADRAFFQLLYGGNVEKAATLASRLVADDPANSDDLMRLMHVLRAFKAGDWPEVRNRIDSGMGLSFGFVINPLLAAWSHGAEGNMEAAQHALEPLMNDNRLKSIASEHTAYLFDYLKRYDEAKESYAAVTGANPPPSLQPAVAFTYMLYKTGKRAQARTFIGEQVTRFNRHSFLLREGSLILKGETPSQLAASPRGAAGIVFYRLATEFAQSKSTQAAILYARIASYLTPEVPDIYFLLGELLEQGGSTDAAAAAYNRVPIKSPLRKLADARRIDVLRVGGRTELAERLIRNELRHSPRNFSMLLGLADILQQKEAFEESIELYTKALSTLTNEREGDWNIYFARAVSYERLGNWPKAEADMLKALELKPDQPDVLNYLGYTWIDKGQHFEKAKAMIQKAADARPEDGFVTDSLGWAHYLTGDYVKAVEVLERAVMLEPDDVTINAHLGDAYWKVGRRIEARFQWQHAIDSGAEGDELTQLERKLLDGLEENS